MDMDSSECRIKGNGDLYGLGIRIGIYCQWISSWLRMLVDEESAEEVYGVNAIFVFAVIIATILALLHSPIRPIELYVMLQISLGFFITVLSTIGIRNHFLRPKRIALIWRHFRRVVDKRKRETERRAKIWTRRRFWGLLKDESSSSNVFKAFYKTIRRMTDDYLEDAAARQYQSNPNFEVPLEYLTPFKPKSISWVGALWRTAILGIIAGFNMYFWFYVADKPAGDEACGPPSIFIFSKQPLGAPILLLSQIVSVIIVVVVLPVCLFLAFVATFLVIILTVCGLRDSLYSAFPAFIPRAQHLRHLLVPYLERVQYYLRVTEFIVKRTPSIRLFVPLIWLFILSVQLLSFYVKLLDPGSISIGAFARAAISLFTPSPENRTADPPEAEVHEGSRSSRSIYLLLSIAWNAIVLLTIVWFILSIELALDWNNIEGINEIKTTGQLIPFIIGCVSTCQVLKEVGLIGLRKLFPDWVTYDLQVAYTARGGIRFHINDSHPEGETISAPTEK